ncbi:hypothetical protein [Hoeflea sp. TYP-13]|uniref:hypothetical protein n=1 Tax=Hoeflea sp. TYP-13 TaxID=3230023 RepID=UPI0034C69772
MPLFIYFLWWWGMYSSKNWFGRQLQKYRKNPRRMRRKALRFIADDYLTKTGWIDSFRSHQAFDGEGAPIPWVTYSAVHFLETRVRSGLKVFEYGSGNSTLWWVKHNAEVVSCEHDPEWYQHIHNRLPSTVSYHLYELKVGHRKPYAEAITQYKSEFQVVVIDGEDRVECGRNCVEALTDDGVIIWDNTNWEIYKPGLDFLTDQGFRRLDFYGLGPVMTAPSLTTIFYRSENCLNI